MKYFPAIAVLLLALMLELWFAPGGMRGDFVLATLVVFAFIFDAGALAVFSAAAAFCMDPAFRIGGTMLLFVLVPFAVFFLRRRFSIDPWFGVPIGIVLGIGVFYAIVAPVAAVYSLWPLALDTTICALFGEAVWYGMEG
jgi:hypothetical protein